MKKLIMSACIAGALFAANGVTAQDAPGLRLGNIGFETGFSLEDGFTIPLGGTFKFETPISSQLHGTATAGYISVQGDEIEGFEIPSYDYVPLKAGLKYYAAGNFYVDGEIGAGIGVSDGSETKFLWAPGVGYQFPVADNKFVDLSARFENVGELSNLGIRLGYSFNL
ncbi:hypothetical protein EDD80_101395 [Anseongella ginsenosidimutans]|uniref:Outer membrane protein with beta-barrel domain n=1 Tax=Anseongella ginsenosidimutans TaxID=496056 RepID=A0A4R3KYR6_9SPHI|nr:hypothetical protein [Anseongella ginsenosidimutans]QEC51135.1 hypothetical protein FRZ59_01395 [Anseongella ginsenosidimutans]TCS90196.1 hypothetical protein EDD80_101395 [Anseongella ginsenosidimutans]